MIRTVNQDGYIETHQSAYRYNFGAGQSHVTYIEYDGVRYYDAQSPVPAGIPRNTAPEHSKNPPPPHFFSPGWGCDRAGGCGLPYTGLCARNDPY